ncbi:hypothetical protein ES703_89103 [subsurface metagenome]
MNNKQEDEIFCPECGKPIKKNAVICVHCGVQVKELAYQSKEVPTVTHKNRTAAVVLAVFFNYLSWLYTYKRSRIKFWIALSISMIWNFLYFVSIFGTISDKQSINYYFANYGTWAWLASFFGIGVWIWAIIDNATKPNSFYENYPKG